MSLNLCSFFVNYSNTFFCGIIKHDRTATSFRFLYIFFSSFYLFKCNITMWFSSSTNFHITNNTDKNNEKKSERGKKSKHMVLHQWIFSTVLPFDTKKKKKPATFVFVVIICFMFLLKPKIHCSLLRWSVRVSLNKKENFFTVACALCTIDEPSSKERHHVSIVQDVLFVILIIVYILPDQKKPKSLLS